MPPPESGQLACCPPRTVLVRQGECTAAPGELMKVSICWTQHREATDHGEAPLRLKIEPGMHGQDTETSLKGNGQLDVTMK